MRALRRAILLLLLLPAAARAQTDEQRRDLVDKLLFDDEARFTLPPDIRAVRARQALEHLRVLIGKNPQDPELHFLAAKARLQISDELGFDKSPPELCHAAIKEYDLVRRLAPDGARAETVASDLGILYSKLGDFERALGEYDRAIRLHNASRLAHTLEDGPAANLYGNSAETLMALGRLDQAIARYQTSADSASSAQTRGLAWYGLAVAYDRDEQLEKSREAMRQALALDPPMHYLTDDGVFFMPLGDQHYYFALGYLQRDEPTAAAASFRAFLTAQPRSRWAGRAVAHLAELANAPRTPSRAFHITVGEVKTAAGEDLHLQEALQSTEPRLRACFPKESFTTDGAEVNLIFEAHKSTLRIEGTTGARVPPGTVRCIDTLARDWRLRDPGPAAGTTHITVPLRLEAR